VKTGSTQYFTQFLVEDHRYPITSVTVNGQNATRESYNYWQAGSGNSGKGPFDLVVTDVNGSQVQASLDLSPGMKQVGVEQFPLCR
jgi:expansin (peptidoglycan-binding protein)